MVGLDTAPSREPSTAETIAAAAIRLAGERGWRGLSLADIALEAGVTLAEEAAQEIVQSHAVVRLFADHCIGAQPHQCALIVVVLAATQRIPSAVDAP